ncbi:hypothetical protein CERSUDRAFT_76811 [Gelatoporia subvermispora B]|uniref:Protein kinase domain-containing protein n=1 Tax=Ceriporiopsis subvermispora (strain B) TaxID=914234 RepID=M2R4H5_CERS8|nr:hypothetical protein CERSUDRAFT_76811 [Gelatoporia subvermispora B]
MTVLLCSPTRYLLASVPLAPLDDNGAHVTVQQAKSQKLISRRGARMSNPRVGHFTRPLQSLLWSRRFERIDMPAVLPNSSILDKYIAPVCRVINDHALRYGSPALECAAFDTMPGQESQVFGIGLSHSDAPWRDFCDKIPNKWTGVKQAFCISVFAPPGILRQEYFDLEGEDRVMQLPDHINRMVDDLREVALAVNAPLGLLTDETMSVVIKVQYFHAMDKLDIVYREVIPLDMHPVRYILGALVHNIGFSQRIFSGGRCSPPVYRASLPRTIPTMGSLADALASRRVFADWDIFVMQRSRQEWELFLQWKSVLAEQAHARPIMSGDTLTCVDPREFKDMYFTMRSPFPKLELPLETVAAVQRWFRPRHICIDNLLRQSSAAGHKFSFVINEDRRTGDNFYSQVFFGSLKGSKTRLCLKLYDERRFPPIGADDDPEFVGNPSHRLQNLEYAVEVARKEEAAYDRLSDLQGSLIPHYYGIYLFQLPDGAQALGFLMEAIEAPSLLKVDVTVWSDDVQIDYVVRMRQAFRALRYAGVDHGDDQARNVLCPQIHPANISAPEIVIIDFGRASLWLLDGDGAPAVYRSGHTIVGLGMMLENVGIKREILDTYWDPLQDEER